jgi:glycosyltransferase involved in cell wall biosynthesis
MSPMVTFVVPCYKLAHLLAECVGSILEQTYEHFEVLILDDCSPDNTPEVAQSFADPRVRYIRNEPNLGHLRNYNKGIALARGEYVWLISADDRLRNQRALEQYVHFMESHPTAGFVCCPAVELINGKETGLAKYSVVADQDTLFRGHEFLKILLYSDVVIAGSGMVRRSCYEKFGAFPLDMPYAGDWYMWCLFSLHYDVAYLADPMVNYRGHDLSMTNVLRNKDINILVKDNLNVLWRTLNNARNAMHHDVVAMCRKALAYEYARYVTGSKYAGYDMSLPDLNHSVELLSNSRAEAKDITARVFISVGDQYFGRGDINKSQRAYIDAIKTKVTITAIVKWVLLKCGPVACRFRANRTLSREKRERDLVAAVSTRSRAGKRSIAETGGAL